MSFIQPESINKGKALWDKKQEGLFSKLAKNLKPSQFVDPMGGIYDFETGLTDTPLMPRENRTKSHTVSKNNEPTESKNNEPSEDTPMFS